jgi:hypothetical protein
MAGRPADQAGADGDSDLDRGAGHPEDRRERAGAELRVGDQRRQGDDVADVEAEHDAGGEERGRGGRERHGRQRGCLHGEHRRREHAAIHPVGQGAGDDATEQRAHGRRAHGERGLQTTERRLQERQLVHDEADLDDERQAEGQAQGPEAPRPQRLAAAPRAPGHGVAARCGGRDGAGLRPRPAHHERGERERDDEHRGGGDRRRRGESARLADGHQSRDEQHAAHAGPVSASVTAGALRSGNHGRIAEVIAVRLRHAHPIPITTSATNSCHGSLSQPRAPTAAPMVTEPTTITTAGPRRSSTPPTISGPSPPTR